MSEYVPCQCGGTRYRKSLVCRDCYRLPTDLLIDELDLLAHEAPERAAERVGLSCAAIARRLYRAERYDLAKPYRNAARRQEAAA